MVLLIRTPYIRAADDRLQMLAQFDIFLLLTVQHTYSVEGAPTPGDTVDIALSAFLILLSIIIIFIFLYNVITYFRTAVWNYKRKAQEEVEKRVVREPDYEDSKIESYAEGVSPSHSRAQIPAGEPQQPNDDMMATSGSGNGPDGSFIISSGS